MPKKKRYDVIVIGSGSAGFSAALSARTLGASVCLIEKQKLGGECPNFACIPSKALLKTAHVYQTVRKAKDFGISTGSVNHEFAKLMSYRNSVVEKITGGGTYGDRYIELAKKQNIDLIHGHASFFDEHIVEVNGDLFEGKAFVLATGSSDIVPPIKGIEEAHCLGWKEALSQTRQPKSMAIIGGGPVGCEIGTLYNALGTRVVLFQDQPTILNREDPEIASMAHEAAQASGIEIVSPCHVVEIINSRGGVYGIKANVEGNTESFAVEQVVLATGKRANVEGLHLDDIFVSLDDHGTVKSNAELRTNLKHIYVAGSVKGGTPVTQTAHYEGSIAGYNAALVAKNKRSGFKKSDQRVVPRVTFVHPEVASVGLTQPEAKQLYRKVLVGRARTDGLGRSVTEHAGKGMVKIIAHPKTGKILGGHVVCERAGEVVHELALAMFLNTTVEKLGSMIHAFPTFSEGVVLAANSAKVE